MALFDAFLKLDGIKGESADSKHKGEIDILSFQWGATQGGSQSAGGGGGTGKVHFYDLHFVKHTDASSPLLMLNCANGAHIKEATLTVRKAGGTQLEYLKIKLTDILVSSYKEHGLTAAQKGLAFNPAQGTPKTGPAAHDAIPLPLEAVSLNFAKIEYQYQPQNAQGAADGGPVIAGWDVKGNVKV